MTSKKAKLDKLMALIALLILPAIFVYAIGGHSLPNHLKNIAKEQLLEDYDSFWEQLEKHDASIYALDRDMVRQVREKGQAEVEALIMSDGAAREFANILMRTIAGLNYTGHLGIVESSTIESYKKLCAGGNNDVSMPDYSRMFDDKKVTETAKWLRGNTTAGGGSSKSPKASFEHIDGEISHIILPSFSNSIVKEDGPRVAKWIEEHIDDKAMIIDIRGNRGGTTNYWQDNICPYLLKEDIRITKCLYVKEWPTYPDASKMEAYFESAKASAEDIAAVEALPNFDLPQELEDATLYCYNMRCLFDDSIPHFKRDVYLLVDENTGSAAEYLTRFIKETGLGIIIGMPTKVTSGTSANLTPIIYSLPNTGLCFRCYLGYSLNPDGSCAEVYSVQPDYVTDGDALEYCLNMIKEGKR